MSRSDKSANHVSRDRLPSITAALAFLLALLVGVVAPPVQAQTNFKLLHAFTGPASDGALSYANLTRDAAGNLFGSTYNGGKLNAGTIFQVDPQGRESIIHSFNGNPDGAYTYTSLVRADNFYGTTNAGGAYGFGTVFKLSFAGVETVLHNFSGGADGAYPYAGLIRDSAGNLYGTTEYGGSSNVGTVFKLDSTGKETVLYSFSGGSDGKYPAGGLVRDAEGNLYGTTGNGGTNGNGVVFKVDPAGAETVLHRFTGVPDGQYPFSTLIRDANGYLYGTTTFGGASGQGAVFKVSPDGKEKVLYSFSGGADGRYPGTGALAYAGGTFYGVANNGGAYGLGVVYKLDSTGKETVLYSFTGGTDGGQPASGVVRDSAGNLYGTTSNYGGTCMCGTVFELTQ